MRIEEITDEVAERLKISQAEGDQPQLQGNEASENPSSQDSQMAPATAAMFPELSPGRAMTSKKTVDEVVADLKSTPFFMTELEENDETEALKALAYEGTPAEVAAEFKDRGNECFRSRRWADAREFYAKGVLVLAAEERKRATGRQKLQVAENGEGKGESQQDDVATQRAVLESLYVNRAACHLELGNYRSCWLDCAAALRLNDRNVKAYYRSAKAFLAVGRVEEADEACARGLAIDEHNNALRAVARDIIQKSEEVTAKRRKEAERLARNKQRETLLRTALKARGIRTRATAKPPEMEDARVKLVPDPDDPRSALCFPVLLLYPAHLRSDLVKAFAETEALADHLAYVLPTEWDAAGEYASPAHVECYMETRGGGLVKVGKKAPLLKTLSSADVEVVDELVRFFVLPKAKAAGWVREFKEKKAVEKGGG
ncbi:TPR-like protein [Hypoxylon sp. NC1633]|nr:TPR-like protein [Hypoxylon sp. NC1633]